MHNRLLNATRAKENPKDHTTMVPFRIISGRIAALSHFIAKRYEQAASRGVVESLEFLSTNRTAFTLGKNNTRGNIPMVEIEVILDPLSKEAQRIAPVLKVLKDSLGNHASLKVIMNPVVKVIRRSIILVFPILGARPDGLVEIAQSRLRSRKFAREQNTHGSPRSSGTLDGDDEES